MTRKLSKDKKYQELRKYVKDNFGSEVLDDFDQLTIKMDLGEMVVVELPQNLKLCYMEKNPKIWEVVDYTPLSYEDLVKVNPSLYTYKEWKSYLRLGNSVHLKKGERSSHWVVFCDKCNSDIYSLENGSPSYFNTSTDSIKTNKYCRCNNVRKLNEEDKKVRTLTILDNFDLSLNRFVNSNLITYTCNNNHYVETNYNKVTSKSFRGCPECNMSTKPLVPNFKDLNKHKNTNADYLYLMEFSNEKECFIKIGRSYYPKLRKYSLERKGYNIELLDTIKDSHENIVNLERRLHSTLIDFKYTPMIHFDGRTECFKLDEENKHHNLIDLCEKYNVVY